MADRFEFMPIEKLLAQVGLGIGTANRSLVTNSSTDIGTLVVKDANVTVNFEMTTLLQKESNSTEFSLGAKTLSFGMNNSTEKNEDSLKNTVNISMNIVSVMEKLPDNKEKDKDKNLDHKSDVSLPHPVAGLGKTGIIETMFKHDDKTKTDDKPSDKSKDVKANLEAYEKIYSIIEGRIKEFPYDEKSKKEMNKLLSVVKEFVKKLEFEKANEELLKIYKILIP